MTLTSTERRAPRSRGQFRVLVAASHALFAEALELALSFEGYDVGAVPVRPVAGGSASVGQALLRMRPQLVLLDLELGGARDGITLVRPLARAGIDVVAVTSSTDRGLWGEAVGAGASAVLSKSEPLRSITGAVRRLRQGQSVLSHEERDALLRAWHAQRTEDRDVAARMALLSPRESQVLGLLMRGRTVNEIASSAVVSPATVRTQVKSILAKLAVSSQLTAVGMAYQAGWAPPTA